MSRFGAIAIVVVRHCFATSMTVPTVRSRPIVAVDVSAVRTSTIRRPSRLCRSDPAPLAGRPTAESCADAELAVPRVAATASAWRRAESGPAGLDHTTGAVEPPLVVAEAGAATAAPTAPNPIATVAATASRRVRPVLPSTMCRPPLFARGLRPTTVHGHHPRTVLQLRVSSAPPSARWGMDRATVPSPGQNAIVTVGFRFGVPRSEGREVDRLVALLKQNVSRL